MRLLLLLVPLAACTDPTPCALPDGRYQVMWGAPSGVAPAETQLLVAQHQLAVVSDQLALGHIALPTEYVGTTCVCATPSEDAPGFSLCSDGTMITGTVGWTEWLELTATPMTAR